MKQLLTKVKNNPAAAQFIKFAIVGGLGTVLDYTTYLVFTRVLGVWYIFASLAAFIVGLTNNFLLNKFWTFRKVKVSGGAGKQFAQYTLVSLVGISIHTGIMFLLVEGLKLNDVVARLIATGVVLVWNYIANKLWTFKPAAVVEKKDAGL